MYQHFYITPTAGYEPHPTEEYTELAPLKDFDFMSKLVIDWEAATHIPESLGVRHVIVRSGM